MRFTLRSLLALSRSLRQIVINRFNSVSAVGLNFLGSGRFVVMPGTPGQIVNRVKAQESVIPDQHKGDKLQAFAQSAHQNRRYGAKFLAKWHVFTAVRFFFPRSGRGRETYVVRLCRNTGHRVLSWNS